MCIFPERFSGRLIPTDNIPKFYIKKGNTYETKTNKLIKKTNVMDKLLKKLNKKFDEYHKKQLKINNNQNPDYYLFMGKANAIGEVIDLIEKQIKL